MTYEEYLSSHHTGEVSIRHYRLHFSGHVISEYRTFSSKNLSKCVQNVRYNQHFAPNSTFDCVCPRQSDRRVYQILNPKVKHIFTTRLSGNGTDEYRIEHGLEKTTIFFNNRKGMGIVFPTYEYNTYLNEIIDISSDGAFSISYFSNFVLNINKGLYTTSFLIDGIVTPNGYFKVKEKTHG